MLEPSQLFRSYRSYFRFNSMCHDRWIVTVWQPHFVSQFHLFQNVRNRIFSGHYVRLNEVVSMTDTIVIID